ncbi:MAG: hypothetical protein FJ033_07015 [Chloroflexi bacterium]|nr:hypothetical protein [Chloroflexota bacterium]
MARNLADDEDLQEDEEDGKKPPKKPRPPRDWPLIAMIAGAATFLMVFSLITIMAPRRPILLIRTIGEATPARLAAQDQAPATTPAPAAKTDVAAKPAETTKPAAKP